VRITRREAVTRLAVLAAGAPIIGSLPGAAACAPKETDRPKLSGPLGLQLYTLRTEMERDVAETLARVAEIGYEEVEFAGYFGHSPSEIRRFLADAGLETDLIFNHGMEIREFAAHTLLPDATGREAMATYFRPFLLLARASRAGFILDSQTWKAHRHWAEALGAHDAELHDANRDSIAFIAGFVLDLISIVLIIIPVAVAVLRKMGVDDVWFCIMFLIMIQTSYLTPPMAPAIFYLRGISPPEIRLVDMYRGVMPFIGLEVIALAMVMLWPALALWLPETLFAMRDF